MSIITPVATLSYPHLYEPQLPDPDKPDEKPKYSCALTFGKSEDLTAMKRVAIAAAKERWGGEAEAMIRAGKLRMPFRPGEEKDYPEGSTFMNVRSINKPGIVSRIPDPTTGRPMPIVDADEIYPGCQVKASLGVFAYDVKGNRGVSFGLNNVQKWADGERLDHVQKAEDEFDADPSQVADLSDLESPTEDPKDDEDDISALI